MEKSKRDECRQLLRHLVHAKSQGDYHYLEELFAITDDDFHDYFKESWEDCKPMWVTYERDQYLHFANTCILQTLLTIALKVIIKS